jgi:hypothetical protein
MKPRKPKEVPLSLNGCVHQDRKGAPICFKMVSAPGKKLCPYHEMLAAEKARLAAAKDARDREERSAKRKEENVCAVGDQFPKTN